MKKAALILAVILAALAYLSQFDTAHAAREDEVWQERLSSYIETIWSEGRDVLINGVNKYLNFGSESGSGGYGFRDLAGTIQFKNEGGAWTAIGTGSGTVTQINTTYPVTGGPITTTGTIALAFGTTTSNTWAGTQTFTNAPTFSSLSSALLEVDGSGVVGEATAGTDYEVPLTFGDGLTRTLNDVDCDIASAAAFGCLTAADWSTFNNKISSSSLSVSDSTTVDLGYTAATGVFTASVVADSIGDTQLAFNTGQHLTTASGVTFATLDTGQGANELYDMDQNVLTTSAPTFAGITLSSPLTVANGGTGATTFTNNRVLTGNGTSALVDEANLTFDGSTLTLTGNGTVSGTLGIATTSPIGTLAVEQGTENYSLWVGNQGSTTPSLAVLGVNGNGYVGIGTITPTSKLYVLTDSIADPTGHFFKDLTGTAASGNLTSLNINLRTAQSGTGTNLFVFNNTGEISSSDSAAWTLLSGGAVTVNYNGTGSLGTLRGLQIRAARANTGSLTNVEGLTIGVNNSTGSGTITNYYTLYINRPTNAAGATVTNTYGIYIDNQTTAAGTHTNTPYGLYQVGTANNNYFGGDVGIGDTSPSQRLDIDGTNPQALIEESTTEFLRTGVGETAGTSVLGWDDGDIFQLGVYSSPTDTTIDPFLTVLSTGDVGIGTTNPSDDLVVSDSSATVYSTPSNGGADFVIVNTNTTNGNLSGMNFSMHDTAGTQLLGSRIVAIFEDHTAGSVDAEMLFITREAGTASEWMRITNDGNIGIGTTTPVSKLTISERNNTDPVVTIMRRDTGITANDSIGKLQFYASDDQTTSNFIVANIEAQAVNTIATDINPGRLIFRTTSTSVAATPTSHFVIDEAGESAFGTDSTPDYVLEVDKTSVDTDIFALTDSDGACLLNPEAGAITTTCSSDAQLKADIRDAAPLTEWARTFKLRDFTVIASGQERTGVIAQELMETHPEMVSMGKDGYYQVEEPSSWKLLKVIQEIIERDDEQERRILELETRLAALEGQVALACLVPK